MIGLFYCFIEAILPYLSKFYKSKLVSVLYGILEIQIKCEYTKPEEHMEKQINEKIIEIVHQANDMIPVEWDDLYPFYQAGYIPCGYAGGQYKVF